jgi:hypothetical protein
MHFRLLIHTLSLDIGEVCSSPALPQGAYGCRSIIVGIPHPAKAQPTTGAGPGSLVPRDTKKTDADHDGHGWFHQLLPALSLSDPVQLGR